MFTLPVVCLKENDLQVLPFKVLMWTYFQFSFSYGHFMKDSGNNPGRVAVGESGHEQFGTR